MSNNIIVNKTFEFALAVIDLYQRLQGRREYVLSNQLLRSGTSIGANVEEAVAAQSRADFKSNMCIAAKESRETRYWLRLLQRSKLGQQDVTRELQSIEEIIRILTSIVKSTSERS